MNRLLLPALLLNSIIMLGQKKTPDDETSFTTTLKPFAIAQLWSTYSYGEVKNNTRYANQYDIHFRRLKFGAKGQSGKHLKYCLMLHADRLGENNYASTRNSYKGLGLWSAMLDYQLSQKNDYLHLVGGYYNIAVSRESHTIFRSLGTLDKAQTDEHLRKFLSAKNNGIESGIGLGGSIPLEPLVLSYHSSVFLPKSYQHAQGNSMLYTTRVMASIGKKANRKFSYLLLNKDWEKKQLLEIGFGAAYQNNGYINDILFNNSGTIGGDIRMQQQGLILEASYYHLFRSAENTTNFSAYLWHLKALYNFTFKKRHLEACLSYQNYVGSGNKTLYNAIGDDATLDIGINWHINKDKLKLALHYINQGGSASSNNGDYIAGSILVMF